MTADELRKFAIQSAEQYRAWLVDNDKGYSEVSVNGISVGDGPGVFALRLTEPVWRGVDINFLQIKHLDERPYAPDVAKPAGLSHDRRTLLISVRHDIRPLFLNQSASSFKVVSDLRFLVDRIRSWYVQYGDSIALPLRSSSISRDVLPELCGFDDDQHNAIRTIFTDPFVYVWGAPGTGKTAYVLAESVSRYARRGLPVVILAPTNNSLEQSLYSLIPRLNTFGISSHKVIRLGAASEDFLQRYPMCCEDRAAASTAETLRNELSRLRDKLAEHDTLKNLESILLDAESAGKSIKKTLHEMYAEKVAIDKLQCELQRQPDVVSQINADLAHAERDCTDKRVTLDAARRNTQSLSMKAKKFFFRSEYEAALQALSAAESEYSLSQQRLRMYEQGFLDTTRSTFSLQKRISDRTRALVSPESFHAYAAHYPALSSLLRGITCENLSARYKPIMSGVEDILSSYRKRIDVLRAHLQPKEDLNRRISAVEQELSAFADTSSVTLKSRLVTALTVDAFALRCDSMKSVHYSHVFLDEAGYVSLIKSALALYFSCPVTFLGDHMQLPPICEAGSSVLRREEYGGVFLWAQSSLYIDHALAPDVEPFDLLQQYLRTDPPPFHNLTQSVLNKSYRFGPNIARVLAGFIYPPEFHGNDGVHTEIRFINAPCTHAPKRHISPNEINAIKTLVLSFPKGTDFCVLAPYNNQVNALRSSLPSVLRHRVMTIHRSQGREWDFVVLSVTDNGAGIFMMNTSSFHGRRIVNTAISRVKKCLYIVADGNFWDRSPQQLVTKLIRAAGDDR